MSEGFDKYHNTKPYPGRSELMDSYLKRIDETPLTAEQRRQEIARAESVVNADLYTAMREYQDEEDRIAGLFWADFDEEHKIAVLPGNLRSKIHAYAWERGHSSGYHEVMNCGYDIAEMVLAAYAAGKKAVAQ